MKLSALIQDLSDARVAIGAVHGSIELDARDLEHRDIEVGRVRDDSREIAAGDVFVAVRGLTSDGHAFIDTAIERGARAVVVEQPIVDLPANVMQVIVPSTVQALGALAGRDAGWPSRALGMVGITGTNGKTTTTFLVEAILRASGRLPGIIGTVNYRYRDTVKPAIWTTPTALVLHGVLGEFKSAGCTHAAMEVSSIGLEMGRLAALEFDVAAFSNLSQDHLDMHGTMEAYRQAKEQLFSEHLKPDGVAAINIDDPAAPFMIAAAGERRVLRVSCDPEREADIHVVYAESTIGGIRARIQTPRGEVEFESGALLGAYNIANLAMAVAITEALGVGHDAMVRGIAEMAGVPGRVQRVDNDHGLDILVDYAHTPDALVNVLSALKPLAERRLICVFGCGGDRDPSKRPLMGAAVADYADLAVVTSDNPRTEQPQSIIDMILPAVPNPFFVDVDRQRAIRAAVAEAVPGDIVLIAGKGHEDYQILGTTKIHFDDREQAAEGVALRYSFSLDEILQACGGTLVHTPKGADPATARFSRVHYDSRMAASGDLYVAVRGHQLDGHLFCANAVAAGATGVIIEAGTDVPRADGSVIDAYVIAVDAGEDSGGGELDGGRMALGAIAAFHRQRWLESGDKLLIAITGSAGKTTCKQLIAAAMSSDRCVHVTPGSFNNETGVPFTLLGLKAHHDVAVVEMGMRGLGQIDYLVRMAEPSIGVVVNAGIAHVGVVGSVEDIARGKSEVFGRLSERGTAVVPVDNPHLMDAVSRAPSRITFGEAADADVRLVSHEPRGVDGAEVVFSVHGIEYRGRIALPGRHNAVNAACALATTIAAGIPVEHAVAGLSRARAASMRGEILDIGGRHVLFDCYNANPASTSAALHTLRELAGDDRAFAILGDMLELGDTAADAHRQMGRLASELNIEVLALGDHRGDVLEGAGERGTSADSTQAAAARALEHTSAGYWILIKASRGMRLEHVVHEMRALVEED